MGKRIKITEQQLSAIKRVIQETNANVLLKNKIFDFINSGYEVADGVKKLGNEFYDTPFIKKRVNGEIITPNALCDYLVDKFAGLKRSEIINSIEGWYYGDYDPDTGLRKKK